MTVQYGETHSFQASKTSCSVPWVVCADSKAAGKRFRWSRGVSVRKCAGMPKGELLASRSAWTSVVLSSVDFSLRLL